MLTVQLAARGAMQAAEMSIAGAVEMGVEVAEK
jgi:hypothetical protein